MRETMRKRWLELKEIPFPSLFPTLAKCWYMQKRIAECPWSTGAPPCPGWSFIFGSGLGFIQWKVLEWCQVQLNSDFVCERVCESVLVWLSAAGTTRGTDPVMRLLKRAFSRSKDDTRCCKESFSSLSSATRRLLSSSLAFLLALNLLDASVFLARLSLAVSGWDEDSSAADDDEAVDPRRLDGAPVEVVVCPLVLVGVSAD